MVNNTSQKTAIFITGLPYEHLSSCGYNIRRMGGVAMDVNERIRALMEERGWTPYRLAKESGLSEGTVGNIFWGATPFPQQRHCKQSVPG